MAHVHPNVARVRRGKAARAAAVPVVYKLGRGGFDSEAFYPWQSDRCCDCSGFAAWLMGLDRSPKPSRNWWIETTAVYRDAMGKQSTFVRCDVQPGAFLVYPDGQWGQGHIALVTELRDGEPWGYDCSSGSYRRTGNAIRFRSLRFMLRAKAVAVCLRQDLS